MNRRRVFSLVGALALAVVSGVGLTAAAKSNSTKPACVCCGASCTCAECTCDASAVLGAEGCDCCGTSSCCTSAAR